VNDRASLHKIDDYGNSAGIPVVRYTFMRRQASMDWRDHAACRDEDPELFFPVGTSGPALLQIAEAKAVCGRCSVSSECLKWALASGQDAGVWGGLSEDERRALKRRNAGTGTRINA
jgi:WhiB family redox-sensing transcriptional regulator